jgi:hypothetical protein
MIRVPIKGGFSTVTKQYTLAGLKLKKTKNAKFRSEISTNRSSYLSIKEQVMHLKKNTRKHSSLYNSKNNNTYIKERQNA